MKIISYYFDNNQIAPTMVHNLVTLHLPTLRSTRPRPFLFPLLLQNGLRTTSHTRVCNRKNLGFLFLVPILPNPSYPQNKLTHSFLLQINFHWSNLSISSFILFTCCNDLTDFNNSPNHFQSVFPTLQASLWFFSLKKSPTTLILILYIYTYT